MRAVGIIILLVACGGSKSRPATKTDQAGSPAPSSGGTADTPAAPTKKKQTSFPAPPAGSPPTDTWRVTLELPRFVLRARDIVADGAGIYLAATVLSADDVRLQRWVVAKLDGKSALAWSSVEELSRSPAPERLVLADSALIVGGQDSSYEATRLLLVERRDTASGKRTWQKRFTARDPSCNSQGCLGKDAFGGIARHAQTIYFAASVDRPIEGAFGELALAKGAAKAYQTRSDRRGLDVARDDTGIYLLEESMSNEVSLIKLDGPEGKPLWTQKLATAPKRLALDASGIVLWGSTIEKRALDSGDVTWTSPLEGESLDVAVDASGIYVTTKLDAKPDPSFGLARLDPGTGEVAWLLPTSKASDNRPSTHVTTAGEHIYLTGFAGELLYVEKRRKSDGALGDVTAVARTIDPKRKK